MRHLVCAALLLVACDSRRRDRIDIEGLDQTTREAYKSGELLFPGVTLSVATPSSPVSGGATIEVAYHASSTDYAFASVTLELVVGEQTTAIATVEEGDGAVPWTVPQIDALSARLRLFATFAELALENVAWSAPFVIDTSAPLAPDAVLVSSSPTNDSVALVEVLSCEPDTEIAALVHFDDTPPAPTDSDFSPCVSGTLSVDLLADGGQRIALYARDAVGHVSPALVLGPILLDRVAPVPPAASLVSAAITNDPHVVLGIDHCTDRAAIRVLLASGEGALEPCGATVAWDLPADGTHALEVVAIDAAGNLSPPVIVAVVLDRVPPSVSIAQPPALGPGQPYSIILSIDDEHLGPLSLTLVYVTDNGATQIPIVNGGPVVASVDWTTPLLGTTTTLDAQLVVTVTDLAGNQTLQATANFIIDRKGPPAPSLFLLNGTSGYPLEEDIQTFTNPVATFELHVPADDATTITHYCIKRLNTKPPLSHPCWKPVPDAPAMSLDIVGEPHRLGFLPTTVTLYTFIRDQTGNVSTLIDPPEDGEGKDHARVKYDPGVAPSVDNFYVTNTAGVCPEFVTGDLTTAAPDLFFRWNVAFGPTGGTDPEEIRLEYTTDDLSYTEVPGSPMGNVDSDGGAVGGCETADCGSETFTGCYKWSGHGLASDAYVRFRLRAQNSKGIVTVRSSVPPLNVGDTLRFIAGNPDPGIDGNATATVFNNRPTQKWISFDRHSLVANAWGVVFFRDKDNGVLWVDPETGTVSRVARITGTANDGLVADSGDPPTFAKADRIFMTHENDVLVWDDTQIRRIRVDPLTGAPLEVETLLANPGGCTTTCACGVYCELVALPGGDFLFANRFAIPGPTGFAIHRYDHVSMTTSAIIPSGTGYSEDPNIDISTCPMYHFSASYDPNDGTLHRLHAAINRVGGPCPLDGHVTMDASGVSVTTSDPGAPHMYSHAVYNGAFSFSGLDGHVYQYWDNFHHGLVRYEYATDSLHNVIGPFIEDPSVDDCPTGIHPRNCAPDAHDVFVDRNGAVFWVAFGKIRSIEFGDTGQDVFDESTDVSAMDDEVVDVFGQSLDYGEGQSALSARIPFISTLNTWKDGGNNEYVSYMDNVGVQIRQARVGGNMVRLAGNGALDYATAGGLAAASGPLYLTQTSSYMQNELGGLYLYQNARILYSDGPSTPWQLLVGLGGTPYYSAPIDTVGTNIGLGFFGTPFGMTPTRFLFSLTRDTGSSLADGMVKAYARSDRAQRHIAGTSQVGLTCDDDTDRAICRLNLAPNNWSFSRAFYDAPRARWLWRDYDNSGHIDIFDYDDTDAGPANAKKKSLGPPLSVSFASWTYRHDGTYDTLYLCLDSGQLVKATLDTGVWVMSPLDWPIASLSCSGQDLVWSTDGKRIIFPYTQFGLGGIAAYVIVP